MSISRYSEEVNGFNFFRMSNDINGNPRYIVPHSDIYPDYETALKIAKQAGGKKYRGKDFSGIIFTSYNLEYKAEVLRKIVDTF